MSSSRAVVVAVVCASACADDPPQAQQDCTGVEVILAASDYSSSLVCGAPGCADNRSIALGTDPQLAVASGRAFYLARDNDLVIELDPKCGTPKSQASVHDLASPGGSANPQDVDVAPDATLWVPLFGSAKIALLKDGALTSIDLASRDPDGNPQASSLRIVNGKAFVALELLDEKLKPTRAAQMLTIDVATRAVLGTVDLAGRNPFNRMALLGSALFLAEPGSFDDASEESAGIERFDTATSTTKILVHEKDLGGSAFDVAVAEGCGVAIVGAPQPGVYPSSLVPFDPSTGQVFPPALGPTAKDDLQGLAWKGTTLYVGDRGARVLHVFERGEGCSLHESRTIPVPEAPVALGVAL